MRLVPKVTPNIADAGQNVAASGVGEFSHRRQPRSRTRSEYVRKAAQRPHDADPGRRQRVKVPVSECTGRQQHHPHTAVRPHLEPTAQVGEAAAKLEAAHRLQAPGLEGWKIAGKGLKRLDDRRQALPAR